ncbi:MAG: LrgB family protein, partial [Clostridia bacterium]|nr:LrgB family protein [Clostridia bacterium]
IGIFSGVIANAVVIVGMIKLFGMSNELGSSLLPKSITTPIALGVVQEIGGISSITVFAVILSGIIGAVIAPTLFKLLRIKEDISQGLACGTASHGSGTTTALELGEVQGAMSGLAITVTGLITVIVAPIVNSIFF